MLAHSTARRRAAHKSTAIAIAILSVVGSEKIASARDASPVFSPTGPNASAYGETLGYPIGPPLKLQSNMVGNYSHADKLDPTHRVAASKPSLLARAPQELELSYTFRGQPHTLQDYLDRNPTTSLLIARDDTILFEHYQYGRTDRDRFYSQSMAKTITGMLIGIAINEGAIHSIDDLAQTYVPALTGKVLGQTTIRALLQMSSGIQFGQDYGGSDDDAKLSRLLFSRSDLSTSQAVSEFNVRAAPPGTQWHYANIDPEVLGLVLTQATHMTVAEYLQSRIWQPMGAEDDADWVVDRSGQEIAYCCFSATARDYARFALMLAHNGAWNGKQIVPKQWILDATQPVTAGSPLAIDQGTHPWGYGYLVWLMPAPRRTFVMEGVEGQRIFIDAATHLVLVHTAVRLKPTHDVGDSELVALWRALLQQMDAK
ncbi:serine hydrolase [Rhizobium sp. L43]|uniref:serine hydrolase domain-containing protein n=1 Tax=Rhizobium sp. L43 TaxID=2035452 RepID=UPI000BE8EE48|nr:serine hydrolase [Rhizobium sp. L43]PDS75669.1 serine hydrolase [Rhizobium sp. L43]